MKKMKKTMSIILTAAMLAVTFVCPQLSAAESDVIVNADFNSALAPFVSVEDTGFVANKNVNNIASENGQLKYWGIAKDKIIEKNSSISPITTDAEHELFNSKVGDRQKAMPLFSYPPGNGSYGARTYLNLDKAVSGHVLISFDIAQGNRYTLNKRVKTTLYLGEEPLTATEDIKAVTNSVFQLEAKDESGEAWITDNGQLKVDEANQAITINDQQVTPKYSWPANVDLQFYTAQSVAAENSVMAGSPVVFKGADRFVKVDLDVDMTKGTIKYYLDGKSAGTAQIADGTLEKLRHIQFYMPSTGWDVSEVFVDNFSITRAGGETEMTALFADGKITLNAEKTIVGINSLTASDFSVKKCSDNSELAVSGIEVTGTNSVTLTLGGIPETGAEYKIIAGENVVFADGSEAGVASFVVPMTGDGRMTTIFEDSFNFTPESWDENGKWTTKTQPENITTEQSPSAKYLWDKGWEVYHNQSNQEIGHNGWITNAIILEKGTEGENNLRMRFTKDSYRNIYLRYNLDTADKGSSIYRITWDAKLYETKNPMLPMVLLGGDTISGSPRNALQYGYSSYDETNGYGKIVSIGADTNLYKGGAVDKRNDDLTDVNFAEWNKYSLEIDFAERKVRMYINDMQTPLSTATLNDNVSDISYVQFAPTTSNHLELSIDDIKIEKYESLAAVETVRFVNQNDEEILPADTVEAGTKAIKIKFSSAVSINDGDVAVTQGQTPVEVSAYNWDETSKIYTITFKQGLAANSGYTLSVPASVVTDGYAQSFETDEGVFEVSEARILKGGVDAESVAAGEVFGFETEFVNTTAGGNTVSLIYAFYSKDENGAMKLLDFDFDEVVADGGHGKDKIVISNVAAPQNTAVVKAFVWNGVANGGPICECTVVE